MNFKHANAICYSGYREGQSPLEGVYPSYEEIREDLLILEKNWKYLRLYDCSPHAETVLQVIETEEMRFKVMLGIDLGAEMNNPDCPWGAEYSDTRLAENLESNHHHVQEAIFLANRYPGIVFSVSIGNEASVDWNDHMVSVASLISYARKVKSSVKQPVTFCENYVPWHNKLEPLVDELDFISIHSYPAWEYKSIDEALGYTQQNYYQVCERYPDKTVIITEAGWTTHSNGRGIEAHNASEEIQAAYYAQLVQWTNKEKILTFVFEAFDEPWKGSPDAMEPEKHWGLFNVKRLPKLAIRDLYGEPSHKEHQDIESIENELLFYLQQKLT